MLKITLRRNRHRVAGFLPGSRALGCILGFEAAKRPSRGNAEHEERDRRPEQKDRYHGEIAGYLEAPLQPEHGQMNDPPHQPGNGNENPNSKHPPPPVDADRLLIVLRWEWASRNAIGRHGCGSWGGAGPTASAPPWLISYRERMPASNAMTAVLMRRLRRRGRLLGPGRLRPRRTMRRWNHVKRAVHAVARQSTIDGRDIVDCIGVSGLGQHHDPQLGRRPKA